MVEAKDSIILFSHKVELPILAGAELLHDGGEGDDEVVLVADDLLLAHAEHR